MYLLCSPPISFSFVFWLRLFNCCFCVPVVVDRSNLAIHLLNLFKNKGTFTNIIFSKYKWCTFSVWILEILSIRAIIIIIYFLNVYIYTFEVIWSGALKLNLILLFLFVVLSDLKEMSIGKLTVRGSVGLSWISFSPMVKWPPSPI